MASLSQALRELQGPLLPPKDLVEDEDDYLRGDAEEEEDTVFVDAEELCSGGVKAGGLPGRLRGEEATRPWGWVWRINELFPIMASSQVRRPIAANRFPLGWPSCFVLFRIK